MVEEVILQPCRGRQDMVAIKESCVVKGEKCMTNL